MVPAFGYKGHINMDRRHGLLRTWTVTDAAAHDGARLPELLHEDNCASLLSADTTYCPGKNEQLLARAGRRSMIHFRRADMDLTRQHKQANTARSKVRRQVEHVFARQKHICGLFMRTIKIERERFKIVLANMAYNMHRLIWFKTRKATT